MHRAVFIFEGGDLDAQASLELAAQSIEVVNVDRGVFDFFADDGTARLLPAAAWWHFRATTECRPEETTRETRSVPRRTRRPARRQAG
jgi:hypothetical protein